MSEPAAKTAETAQDTEQLRKPDTIMRRRFKKFRSLRRGWYSLIAITTMFIVSLFNPVLINSRPLVLTTDSGTYFPAVSNFFSSTEYEWSEFLNEDQQKEVMNNYEGIITLGRADYRVLRAYWSDPDRTESGDGWLMMPPYPYDPLETGVLTSEGMTKNAPPNWSACLGASLTGNSGEASGLAGILGSAMMGSWDEVPEDLDCAAHWMGLDSSGRDVFARLAYGFQTSILFALGVVTLSYTIGITVGATLGFFGGKVDILGQRLVEIWGGIPFLYTVIIISAIIKPGVLLLIPLLAIFRWIGMTYYMRGEFYREKSKDYVAAAIAQGESRVNIMFRHLLPNSLTPVVSFAPFAFVAAISSLVGLDFLGFGVQPPTPSWGELVSQAQKSGFRDWHLVFFPFGSMFLTLLAVVFIGEAVREAFDPRRFSRLR